MRRRDLIAALAVVMLLGEVHAQPVNPSGPASDSDLFAHFYSDPRPARLVGFLERLQTRAPTWDAFPPVAGFFAIVFRSHSDWIEKLVPDHPDSRTAVAIVSALRLAGVPIGQNLRSRLPGPGPDPRLWTELADLPPRLEELHVVTPTHLDLLWGASFASGDERYVRMITDFLARTANRSELIAIDVAKTAVAISGGPKDILGQLKGRYGEELGREIIFSATAAWAIGSNAREHSFIDKFLTGYIAANSGSPTAKVLLVVRPNKRT